MRSANPGIQQFFQNVSLAALVSIGFATAAAAAGEKVAPESAIGIAEKFAGASAESAA